MTKKEVFEMLKYVPDNANIKIGNATNGLFGRNVTYNNVNGFIN